MKFAAIRRVTLFTSAAFSGAIASPEKAANHVQSVQRRLRIGRFKDTVETEPPNTPTDTSGLNSCSDLIERPLKESLIAFRELANGSDGGDLSTFPNMPCGVDMTNTLLKLEDIQCELYNDTGNSSIEYACEKEKREVGPFLEFARDTANLFEREEHLCAIKGFKLAKNSPSSWYWGCVPCDGLEQDYDFVCN